MEEKERNELIGTKKRVHPRQRANLLSHWFFCWELPFFYKGYKKQITEDDLYGPLKDHQSRLLGDKIEKTWTEDVKTHDTPSLWRVLGKAFGFEFFLYGLLLIPIELLIRISQPLLIGRLMTYYTPNQTSTSKNEAYIYASFIVVSSFLYVVTGHCYAFGLAHLGMKIRVACSSLIYRKSLKLSQSVLAEGGVGQMVNLLSNDVGRFDVALSNVHFLWMGPLETLVILGLLYWMLGPTAVVGIGILLAFIPLQMYLAKRISVYRMRTALKTDQRVRMMNEIIGGIKVIKMYTWEKPFAKLVESARKVEMHQIKRNSYLRAVNMACQIFLGRTAVFSCVLLYVLTGNSLDPEYVYVLSSFYEIIRLGSVIFLPLGMTMFGETITSVKRIQDFLTKAELTVDLNSPGFGITMDKICVKWDKSSPENTLTDVTLSIKPNQLAAVVGPVGSGKSALLQVILKEIPLLQGSLQVGGSISYASQQPWLFGGSVRDNILFGEALDKHKYDEIVRACALEHDFAVLPFGDRTLVGERGVMLSGGQKARINLARAVYKDADLYLLDDPLSAVDAHVGKQLFDNCIKYYLRNKSTVLVTHQLQYLGGADVIHLIENGKLTTSGSYQELKESDNEFLKLLESQGSNETVDKAKDEVIVDEEVENEPVAVKESQGDGVVSNRVYRDYFQAGGTVVVSVVMILLHVVVQLSGNGTDYFLSFWVNLEQERNDTDVGTLSSDSCLYLYSGLVVFLVIIALTCSLLFFRFCMITSTNLHNKMFTKIVRAPMRFFNTNPSGRILNRFSRDIGLIDESLPLSLMDTIEIALNVVAITVIISIINPWILIPTVVMFALFYYYRIIFLASSRNLKRIEGITRSPIYSHITSSLEGLATIRAFKAQTNLKAEFDKYQDLHSSSFYMFVACDGAFGFWLDFTCVVYLGIVTLSFLFIGSENYGASVGLSITQSIMMTGLLQWGMKQSGQLENQMTSVERVVEYSNLKAEPNTGDRVVPQWPTHGKIHFKDVSLRYSPLDPYVLKHLSFEISSGEKIGIVGRTGAGKSSLVSVFFRLAPVEGDLFIDGVNTKTLTLESLRARISIIPQEPVLFSGTIRYNLDPFDEYQDPQLWEALDEVELKSVVADLPSGLSSKVSEGGVNFSVGQRQLLCLARAVVRMNKILILDEATANVDPQTDELIQGTIRRKFRGCTVLTIAHRLHTVMDCDKILVMEDGSVAEFDHPYTLLSKDSGVLCKLVQQTGKEVADGLRETAKKSFAQRSLRQF